jgi:hypothetical protein
MLEIYELLDRFELLYPTNSKLGDLRRAYIDQDLSSIFRLTNANEDLRKAVSEQNIHSIFRLLPAAVSGNIEDLRKAVIEQNLHSVFRLCNDEDLRKAVIEQNLHSVFRLCNDEDLRKLILEDNAWKLWLVLERYKSTQFIAAFKNFFVNDMSYDKDCFSRGQLQSKLWLVSELKKLDLDLGTIFLCAGWYATLAVMLFESDIKIDKIRSFDIDKSTVDIAEVFNKPWFTDQWRFKALVEDIHNINYDQHTWQYWSNSNNRMSYPVADNPNTIINTSCEHIKNFKNWYNKIPFEKLVVLQGNNFFEIEEHVNCSNNLTEFSNKAPMTTVLYEGELSLKKYTRFMKIGFK